MTLQDLKNTQYLGDGIYVGYLYNALWLVTADGIKITNKICLEDESLTALNEYLRIHGKFEE